METSLQKMSNNAIGFVGEAIAKKLVDYARWPVMSSFERLVQVYPNIDQKIKDFLQKNWRSFDLVRVIEQPRSGVQVIEVKTSTHNDFFGFKKELCLTPQTVKLYRQARTLGIEVLLFDIKIPQEWGFSYDLSEIRLDEFSVCKGGGKNGQISYN